MRTQSLPLADTAAALRTGDRSLRSHVDRTCDRIAAVEPDVRALVDEPERRERLQSDAAALEDEYDTDDRPPLYGVPVGVKDIVHVDGFTTRAGTALPPELFQGPEATVVSELKAAGALVLGKTVTTEFAGQGPGLTRNPHDVEHTPGGSSSGSAAAVAAGTCPLAIGTQTGGSVVRPAAFCGVVGFKPSFDRIPTDGVITRSESLDHVGLFSQDVAGMALAASVVCDDWTADASPPEPPTLGVPEGPYLERASDAALDAFEAQLDRLADAGYGIERVPAFEDFAETDRRRMHVSHGELALVHGDWFDEYESFYRTRMAERIRSGREVTTEQLIEGRAVLRERREGLQERMDAASIDLWACPAAPGPAPAGISSTGDSVMNRPWTDAGLPAVTVPAGDVDGLPVGLQCVARYGADERLLAWAEGVAAAVAPD